MGQRYTDRLVSLVWDGEAWVSAPALPLIEIDTAGIPIVSKDDYVNATISIVGRRPYTGTAQIRGRGNSTWVQPKKPYKIKLLVSSTLLGMPADKEWVLLANYLDRTNVRTALAMEVGRRAPGLAWTPRFRYVEVILNGLYEGIYQFGEHVKIATRRIPINKASGISGLGLTGGYSMEIDQRLEENNEPGFRTSLKNIPIDMDEPDDTVGEQKVYIETWMNTFESVLYGSSWLDPTIGYAPLIDQASFIDWYLINEMMGNQDAGFFASCKLYKTRDTLTIPGRLHFGPLWDFDLSLDGTIPPRDGPTGFFIRDNALWFARMMDDPSFWAALVIRWRALTAAMESGRTIDDFIDTAAALTAAASARDGRRWGYTPDAGATNDSEAWLAERTAWLATQFV